MGKLTPSPDIAQHHLSCQLRDQWVIYLGSPNSQRYVYCRTRRTFNIALVLNSNPGEQLAGWRVGRWEAAVTSPDSCGLPQGYPLNT